MSQTLLKLIELGQGSFALVAVIFLLYKIIFNHLQHIQKNTRESNTLLKEIKELLSRVLIYRKENNV